MNRVQNPRKRIEKNIQKIHDEFGKEGLEIFSKEVEKITDEILKHSSYESLAKKKEGELVNKLESDRKNR
ncbi:hypothetical protein AKJ39_01400 [candidate division MSBL1 archaeon SCGC-AAA259J03]|uniref:Uncharacterized protein n=1 Tax=candidate division MSBL1 archaeon SCGC-AAA259J03 TaxID=1698269 RepID=A0A656YXF2_9EURY|nr:hypothetical protein AKJ39_01400 [candidate division MSBL1 archaeon SCGC-AAA259J03]